MEIRHVLIALALTAPCGQSLAASPVASWQSSLPPLGENRIVGLWQAALTLAPCTGGPATSINALNTFHAGGTLNSTDNAPQPSNGPAQGLWEYRGHGRYMLHVQFFTFLPDGTHSGPADVHQELTLDPRGNVYTSVLSAHVLDTHGNPVVDLCGTAQGSASPSTRWIERHLSGARASLRGAPRPLSRAIHPFIAKKRYNEHSSAEGRCDSVQTGARLDGRAILNRARSCESTRLPHTEHAS